MENLRQQIHKNCGGLITVFSNGYDIYLMCDKCNTSWEIPSFIINAPSDWEGIKK
ncbi:MAG: hypothetical protein ACOCQ4_01730 [bacterium]